jgi:hypothetical protein
LLLGLFMAPTGYLVTTDDPTTGLERSSHDGGLLGAAWQGTSGGLHTSAGTTAGSPTKVPEPTHVLLLGLGLFGLVLGGRRRIG